MLKHDLDEVIAVTESIIGDVNMKTNIKMEKHTSRIYRYPLIVI